MQYSSSVFLMTVPCSCVGEGPGRAMGATFEEVSSRLDDVVGSRLLGYSPLLPQHEQATDSKNS
jgi:hypothetical protein